MATVRQRHCPLPADLGAFEIDVPRLGPKEVKVDNATGGLTRFRLIMLPGIGGSTAASPFWEPPNVPTLSGGSSAQLRQRLNAAGIQTVQVSNIPQFGFYQWDMVNIAASYGGIPTAEKGLLSDIANDPGFGARLANKSLLYWDHIIEYCRSPLNGFGGDMPVFVMGMSWGAWWGLWLATHRPAGSTNSPLGVYSHCIPNDWAKCNPGVLLFAPLPGWQDQGTAFFAGMNISTTALNAVTMPVRGTWGISDAFICGGTPLGEAATSPPPVDSINMIKNGCLALDPGATITGSVGDGSLVAGDPTTQPASGGSVTGIGMAENHLWDNVSPGTDTNDCVAWFTRTPLLTAYPRQY